MIGQRADVRGLFKYEETKEREKGGSVGWSDGLIIWRVLAKGDWQELRTGI